MLTMQQTMDDRLFSKHPLKRTFKQIFPSAPEFHSDLAASGLYNITVTQATTLYALLYGRYANSTQAFDDEYQFKMAVFSIIYQNAPTIFKQEEIQQVLREITEEELLQVNTAILNEASNPASLPEGTDSDTILPFINNQNVSIRRRAKMEAYATLDGFLKQNLFQQFLDMFKPLFVSIAAGEPLYYTHDNMEVLI